jgi:hypothetical protein
MLIRLALVIPAFLSQTPASKPWTFAGRGYPSFGTIVGKAGDVDKDGIPDFVIGDPGYASERIPPTFWIVSGRDGGVLRRVVITQEGPSSDCFCVDGGADIDGDGIPDLLIASASYGSPGSGSVTLVSGKSGAVLWRSAICGTPSGVIAHHGEHWLQFVHDFNGDGVPDLAALCLKSGEACGTLVVRSGRTADSLIQLPVKDECGSDIAGFTPLEDVDSDGAPDFAVLMGGRAECRASLRAYSTAKKTMIWEHRSDLAWGTSARLAGLGDLDADGVRDLAVTFDDTVAVVSGRTGKLLYGIGSPPKDGNLTEFGWEFAVVGDIDHDQVPDFALSETDSGFSNGQIHMRSGVDGHALWDGAGGSDDELWHLGYQLAALGDIDGDGVCDLVAGTCGNMSGEPGRARVLSGKDGSLVFQFARKGDDVVMTRRKEKQTPR